MIGVRISAPLEAKMNEYAKEAGITKSQLVKEAVFQFLRQHELRIKHDEYTLEAIHEIKKGKGIPGDVVMKKLADWGRGE